MNASLNLESAPNLRFVVLFHQVPTDALPSPPPIHHSRTQDHWDLMFEWNGKLLTWAVDTEPFVNSPLRALQLPVHRLDYLHYEGAISGQRGNVRRIQSGEFQVLWNANDDSNELPLLIEQGKFQLLLKTEGRQFSLEFRRLSLAQPAQLSQWDLTLIATDC